MANFYYDKEKLESITRNQNSDPYNTCKNLKMYLTKHPKDRMAYIDYARILITIGRLTEAEEVLNKLETLIAIARQKNRDKPENIDIDENDLFATRLKLLAWQNKYEEALFHYYNHKSKIETTNESIESIIFYCAKQLGLLSSSEFVRYKYHYKIRQLIQYIEQDFRHHEQRHLNQKSAEEHDFEELIPSYFENDFPFDKILSEVKEAIQITNLSPYPETKRLNGNYPINIYVFKYPNCGNCNGQLVDYFKVAVLYGSSDIITMYPSTACEKLPHTDLSHLVEISQKNQPKAKVKSPKESRIDRFNKRFGLK